MMDYSFRLFIAFSIFVVSGLISSALSGMYEGIEIDRLWISPIALIFGIAYLITHSLVINKSILREKLLKSTLFLIFGTQMSYYLAVQSVTIFHVLPPDGRMFSYLFGSVIGALILFYWWRMIVPINQGVSALMKILLSACIAFLITSTSGFHNTYDGWGPSTVWPNSMLIFFISWQVMVGMTLLYVAKKYQKTEAPDNTQNQEIILDQMPR